MRTAIAAAALLAACTSPNTTLADAHNTCRDVEPLYTAQLNDDGQSLVVEGKGVNEIVSVQQASVASTMCVLEHTDAPDSVWSRIQSTSALNGQQEATHDGLTYRWTFHPDNGIDLIIELEQ